MLVKPTVAELLDKIGDNRFSLAIMTAKRARQLVDGAEAKVETDDRSKVTIAAKEILAGEVKMESYGEADNAEDSDKE